MGAYYLELRSLHIACVVASITLFVLRHVLNLWNVRWRNSRALRIMPHVVDSVLLLSALALCFAIQQYPFVNGWLTVKLIALVAYIILGSFALKRAPTQGARRLAFLAAVIVFGFIVTVARTHSPWGIFTQFR
jgi:uncharacterized membrane protein SirB2